jgi:type III secretory pathway component EscS
MSPWVLDFVQEAFGVGIMVALPFVGAAVAGSMLAGLVQWIAGLQDPAVATIARGVAVVALLVLLAGLLAEQLSTYVREAWSELPHIGRAE